MMDARDNKNDGTVIMGGADHMLVLLAIIMQEVYNIPNFLMMMVDQC